MEIQALGLRAASFPFFPRVPVSIWIWKLGRSLPLESLFRRRAAAAEVGGGGGLVCLHQQR